MDLKAQLSAEFFVFLGLAFLVAIIFEVTSLRQLNDFNLQNENEAIKDIALKLQKELLLAAVVEDGYVRNFNIPDNVDGFNYTLTKVNATLTAQSKNSIFIVSIPFIVGNLSKNSNIINKTGGVIYVN